MECGPGAKVNASSCTVDCTKQPCTIEPYGDIGGAGVILAFMVTAWFVVVLLVVYYITVYDYALDVFRPKDDFHTLSKHPNPVDRVFLSIIRNWRPIDFSKTSPETRKNVNKYFNKCVLAFADLQIMTGIGILISGVRPTVCGLQAYHLQVIVHLAWFSSITHLAALSFLRNYLANHRRELYVRGVLMAVLAGLLAGAVGLAGHFDWDARSGFREPRVAPSHFARCALLGKLDGGSLAFEAMVFDMLLIVYGYTVRLLKTWRKAWHNWVENVCRPLFIAFPRVLYLQLHIFTSYLAEVFWLVFSVTWRTVRLASLVRRYRPAAENDWAFGQVLPLMMMASPLILLYPPIASLYRVQKHQGPQRDGVQRPEGTRVSTELPQPNGSHTSFQVHRHSQTFREEGDEDLMFVFRSAILTPRYPSGELDTGDITDAGRHVVDEHGDHERILRYSHTADNHGPTAIPISHSPRTRSTPEAHEMPDRWNSYHTWRDNYRPDDDNALFRESSTAFQGGLFLVSWWYVELAIYLLLGDRKGFIRPAGEHGVSFLVFNPFLQTSWIVFTLFAFRIPVEAPGLFFPVFTTLLAASLVLSRGGLIDIWIALPIVIGVYVVITTWAAFAAGERYSRLRPFISRYLACMALVGISSFGIREAPEFIPVPITFHGLLLAVGKLWPSLARRAAFAGIVLIIISIGIQGWGKDATQVSKPSKADGGFLGSFVAYPLFSPLVDFSLWVLGWAVVIALWPVGGWVVRGTARLAEHFFRGRNIGP